MTCFVGDDNRMALSRCDLTRFGVIENAFFHPTNIIVEAIKADTNVLIKYFINDVKTP